MFWRSFKGRPENVLGTSQINLPGTFLGRQIRTSPGCHFGMSRGFQIGLSPGWPYRFFRGCPGDLAGRRPRDVLGTNICQLGSLYSNILEPPRLVKNLFHPKNKQRKTSKYYKLTDCQKFIICLNSKVYIKSVAKFRNI